MTGGRITMIKLDGSDFQNQPLPFFSQEFPRKKSVAEVRRLMVTGRHGDPVSKCPPLNVMSGNKRFASEEKKIRLSR